MTESAAGKDPASPIAELRDVRFGYGEEPVLEDVDLRIGPRDFLGVLGPNGGGKTTLLRLLLGLVRPWSGSLRVLGEPPWRVRWRIGYVPQHATLDPTVPADVLDIVLLGRLHRSSWGPRYGERHREAALAALEEVGAADLRHRAIAELSGGQRQRVLIARALATEAELLLLDEPTTGIDLHRERELLELLLELNESLPIVLVTHDVALVSGHLERAIWVDRQIRVFPAGDLSVDAIERMVHRHADSSHGTTPEGG